MNIKRIVSQNRRDFVAIYRCEHCGHEEEGAWYDDANFHNNVVPGMACRACDKVAGDEFRALTTKYPEGVTV